LVVEVTVFFVVLSVLLVVPFNHCVCVTAPSTLLTVSTDGVDTRIPTKDNIVTNKLDKINKDSTIIIYHSIL
jgi:hypothetical protein